MFSAKSIIAVSALVASFSGLAAAAPKYTYKSKWTLQVPSVYYCVGGTYTISGPETRDGVSCQQQAFTLNTCEQVPSFLSNTISSFLPLDPHVSCNLYTNSNCQGHSYTVVDHDGIWNNDQTAVPPFGDNTNSFECSLNMN